MQAQPTIYFANMAQAYAIDEAVEAYAWAAEQLGYRSHILHQVLAPAQLNILFAAYGLHIDNLHQCSPYLINLNLEQMRSGSGPAANNPSYYLTMRRYATWDYSLHNIEHLNACGIPNVQHMPLGYSPSLERIKKATDPDIDVLFYGSTNPRRRAILQKLQDAGLKVVHNGYQWWTAQERDALIARSKIVLNIAFYDQGNIFEEIRCAYLFNNRIAVVSERCPDSYMAPDLQGCSAMADPENLAQLCLRIAGSAIFRQQLADHAYEVWRARPFVPMMERALKQYWEQKVPVRDIYAWHMPLPKNLNLLGNRNWLSDHINVDADITYGADVALDIAAAIDFDLAYPSWRFGEVLLEQNSFAHITAHHILHRVADLAQCMRNCLEWLQEGGTLSIIVPYDKSHSAWSDPHTRRSFNENTWNAFSGVAAGLLGWNSHCFDVVEQLLIESAQAPAEAHTEGQAEQHRPSILHLQTVLRKRQYTEAELSQIGPQNRPVFPAHSLIETIPEPSSLQSAASATTAGPAQTDTERQQGHSNIPPISYGKTFV